MVRRLTLVSLLLVSMLGGGAAAQAAEPPNQNDPCSRNGRNTCGTNGEGSYRNYRYGIRWFGDYRKVIDDSSGGTFCIDLRFWYPSKSFDYEERSAAGLRNKENESISTTKLRRMNRALWRYGRSDNAAQQAAVMVYVHRLMADGAPGEADPRALSPASRRIYSRVTRDAARYAGPYEVKATLPERLTVGQEGELTIEVVTASGRKVPGVEVDLSATGAEVAERVSTGSSGTVKTTVKATAAGNLRVEARATSLPAALPTLYVPTRGQSARNAQRIVSAQVARPSVTVQAPVRSQPQIVTQISEQVSAPGAKITDTVRVTGLGGQAATIQAALYGPYPSREAITCTDQPVWTGTLDVPGDGEYVTAPVTLTVPGYYTYRESIAETDTIAGVQTACAEVSETTIVRGKPAITTQISAQESTPGSQITDSVVVTGLGKLTATVNVALWGPYPSRAAMTCEGTPFWTGTFPASGDGTYTTAPVTLTQAGYYTYQESIAATDAFDTAVTRCGEVSETTLAKAAPKVTTIVSDAVVKPDAEIFDRLTVSGLGQTPATVELELFGPYASRADIDCAGKPYWEGKVEVTGDGEYSSPKATVRRAGFYVFRERIAGSEFVAAHQAECLLEAETSLSAPTILGGRGDDVAYVAQGNGGPSRVRLGRLRINAPVSAIGIDLKSGALGIPENIRRVGWWRDGAAPGDENGTVLIAGHVDSAKDGAGAFYSLKSARRGDTVTLRSGGRTLRYRVTSMRRMRKAALPSSIYTRAGSPKLVLVTCGGPFDSRSGHYRDNIVVTAVPV